MKIKLPLMACAILASASVFAQGQINFANRITTTPTVTAPILTPDGANASGADGYMAQLYIGLDAGSLVAVGSPVALRSDGGIGYIVASAITTAFAGGTVVQAQVWAWAGGASYEAATVAIGKSNIIPVTVGDPNGSPPGVPANLVGLTSIATTVVPEPATLALAGIGGLGLLALRRKSA